MSHAWSRLVKGFGLALGVSILLQGVNCAPLFVRPDAQGLVDFAVSFFREALAAYLL